MTQYWTKLKNKGNPEPRKLNDFRGASQKLMIYLSTSKPQHGQVSTTKYRDIFFQKPAVGG
jgi:hypothetical protein